MNFWNPYAPPNNMYYAPTNNMYYAPPNNMYAYPPSNGQGEMPEGEMEGEGSSPNGQGETNQQGPPNNMYAYPPPNNMYGAGHALNTFYGGSGDPGLDAGKRAYMLGVAGDHHNYHMTNMLAPTNTWNAMQGIGFTSDIHQRDDTVSSYNQYNLGSWGAALGATLGNWTGQNTYDWDTLFGAGDVDNQAWLSGEVTDDKAYLSGVETDNAGKLITTQGGTDVAVDDAASLNTIEERLVDASSENLSTVVEGTVDQANIYTKGAVESDLSAQNSAQDINRDAFGYLADESIENVRSDNRQRETIVQGDVNNKSTIIGAQADMATDLNQGAIEAVNTQVKGQEDRKNILIGGEVDYRLADQQIIGGLATIDAKTEQQAINRVIDGVETRKTNYDLANQDRLSTASRIITQGKVDMDQSKEDWRQLDKEIKARSKARSTEISDQSTAKSTEIADQAQARSTEIEDQSKARSTEIADQAAARSTEIADQTAARSTEIADQSAARVTEIGAEDDSARNKENRAAARSRSLARAF